MGYALLLLSRMSQEERVEVNLWNTKKFGVNTGNPQP